jgi:hypothetical protein
MPRERVAEIRRLLSPEAKPRGLVFTVNLARELLYEVDRARAEVAELEGQVATLTTPPGGAA